MDDITIDFIAWKEDRIELKQLRDDTMALKLSSFTAAERLRGDAAKINQACVLIDTITANLNTVAS